MYKKKADEFTLDEFNKTFKSLGKAPYWVTISGGEPFLREDVVEICESLYNNCKPKIINIPTNGTLCDEITRKVENILKTCLDVQVIVNLSIDEIGEKHDEIRNTKGNFQKAMESYKSLKALKYPNLTVGFHTVISKYNVQNIPTICTYLYGLNPDSYIAEIAEERGELDTIGSNFIPSLDEYSNAIDFISRQIKKRKFSGISNITQAFRLEYYQLTKKILRQKRQVIPCYAGIASVHIAPDGDVWPCCVQAKPIGNLREANYNFRRIWFGDKANQLRREIKQGKCYCPLANAAYTNMLCHLRYMFKIGFKVLMKKL